MSILRVENLVKTYPGSGGGLGRRREPVRAVDDVSFAVERGECLGIVGESGSGKTTISRAILGLETPTSGRILFEGTDISKLSPRAMRDVRARIQVVFQDPYASLNPRMSVRDIIAEPMEIHRSTVGLNDRQISARVVELLRLVRMEEGHARRYPHEFSGGQRQRIGIARALACKPELIVLDEPTSALDVSVQAQVLNIMRDLQRERGLTYLFISHNLAVVRHVSDEVGVMYLGRLVEWADKETLFRAPRHPYTRMLLDAIPDIAMTGRARTPVQGEVPNPLSPPAGCAFHPRCPYADERCSRERPALLEFEGIRVACHAVTEGRIAGRA
ncbi:MAG: ATP-binding cassette domain-containing protein [Burkholderiaceae bacterium]|nr:ATP-binding cassette domain-containing protein [Burkholderiaceae bacterium]